MFPVLAFQPLSPAPVPQNSQFWLEPLPCVSSFFLLVLARTPALKKCFPKTAE